jgi:hypothetical protein
MTIAELVSAQLDDGVWGWSPRCSTQVLAYTAKR